MRVNSVNNLISNNARPAFKGGLYNNNPGAFATGVSLRKQEEIDALIRSYAEANSSDVVVVGVFTALCNKAIRAAKILNIIKTPEHKARVTELDKIVREKAAASFSVEA